MAGFTTRASQTSPLQVVQLLNSVFTAFDQLVEEHGLEKIKTTGDGYMVVSGVPVERADHAQALARFALDMLRVTASLRDQHGDAVPIRIGYRAARWWRASWAGASSFMTSGAMS